jgi:hypothetical protein
MQQQQQQQLHAAAAAAAARSFEELLKLSKQYVCTLHRVHVVPAPPALAVRVTIRLLL